jgi:hypothetical protein
VNWTEDGTEISTNPAYSFTATAERNLVANFAIQSYAITAVANPVEGGTITGAGNYNHGSAVNLVASPNEGYEFVNWTEGGSLVSTDLNYNFTVTAERNMIANFTIINSIDFADYDKYKFNIYPNPAREVLNIKFIENDNINNKSIRIYMFNSIGKFVSIKYNHSSNGIFIIPITKIPVGLYLIDIHINNKSVGKGRVLIIE